MTTFGWEEWVALPGLALPAVRAKVDTGARTSALHAFAIEPYGPRERPRVRFRVHPVPGRADVEVECSAPLVARREVMSSNGESEMRFVVATPLAIAGRTETVELSLTDRRNLRARMLLGRQALEAFGALVDPARARLQPHLSFHAYDAHPRAAPERRRLRIALLTMRPQNYSCRRLLESALERGHDVRVIETTRCYMNINVARPEVLYDGQVLPRFDAVIPRIGGPVTAYGLAVVRQFELAGAICLNRAGAIGAARDKLHALQVLARRGVAMPVTAFAHSPKDARSVIDVVGGAPLVVKLLEGSQGRGVVLADTEAAAASVFSAFRDVSADILVQAFVAEAAGADLRCLVVGGRVVAAMVRRAKGGEFRSNLHQGGRAEPAEPTPEERDIAIRATRALGLKVAGVDILRSGEGPVVIEVNASPGLEGLERASGVRVAELIVRHLEARVDPRARRPRPKALAATQ